MVESCKICIKHSDKNKSEPLVPHAVPDRPWQTVGTDICQFEEKNFLVVKDYYCKWITCNPLRKGKTAGDIIKSLKQTFSIFGVPENVISDNMPFNSDEFSRFAKSYDFNVKFSSPKYPQSNGMAESAVKRVKKLMKKCKEDGTDFELAMLDLMNTPITGMEFSPAQLMFNRKLKSSVPASSVSLQPALNKGAREAMIKVQNNQKKFFDGKAATLPELKINQKVFVRNKDIWEEGIVVRILNMPRSYIVKVGEALYRRNRKDIKIYKGAKGNDNDVRPVSPEPQIITVNRPKRVIIKPQRFQ